MSPVTFVGFDGARRSSEALKVPSDDPKSAGCRVPLPLEAVRAAEIAFTAPYVLIEGTYMVLKDSPLKTVGDVDRPGHRIKAGPKSAYDLFLTRTLKHAELVRAEVGSGEAMVQLFPQNTISMLLPCVRPAIGGLTQRPIRIVRVMSDRFMEIRQAMRASHQGRNTGGSLHQGVRQGDEGVRFCRRCACAQRPEGDGRAGGKVITLAVIPGRAERR